MRTLLSLSLLLLLLSGCRPSLCAVRQTLPDDARVQTIGDSILAWGEPTCTAVADHVGYALDTRVARGAISGTRLMGGDRPIPAQYTPGDGEWVIVDGGANDLNAECACLEGCDDVLDRLSTPDGLTGAMPDLIDTLLADGQQVALVSYYLLPESGAYGLGACHEEMIDLNARYAALAAARPAVLLVPLAEVITWEDEPWAFDVDDVHPSLRGARRLGEHIAAEIMAASR